MRIGLFTDTYYPEVNGVANSVKMLKKGLEELGHDVWVITTTHPNQPLHEENIYRIPSVAFPLFKERRVGLPVSNHWLKGIQALDLNLIHTHTEFSIGTIGRRLSQSEGIAHIHTYHTIYEEYIHYVKIPTNRITKDAVKHYIRYFCSTAAAVIVPTEKVRDIIEDYKVDVPNFIIPSGIDIERFQQRDEAKIQALKKQYHIEADQRIFINIGRMSKEKHLPCVIDQFQYIHRMDPRAHLVLVGDGPALEGLKQQVQKLDLTASVTFVGQVDSLEVPTYYALGDVFMSASQSETQGLTYIEALASGLPLLVRQDTCLEDVLEHEKNGYGYENWDDFVAGYHYIDNHLEEMKQHCGICERYSYLGYAKEVNQVYLAALEFYPWIQPIAFRLQQLEDARIEEYHDDLRST